MAVILSGVISALRKIQIAKRADRREVEERMSIALEINFALWGMIICSGIQVTRLVIGF